MLKILHDQTKLERRFVKLDRLKHDNIMKDGKLKKLLKREFSWLSVPFCFIEEKNNIFSAVAIPM